VVDAPGNNLLADFASVVDAVHCSVAIQQALRAKNIDVSEHRKMEFRLGLNLGDVVVEGETDLWRWHQHRRAAREPGGTRWYLHFWNGLRSDREQAGSNLRGRAHLGPVCFSTYRISTSSLRT
jgi:hypothetical protein